jgi:hypothetical protein
MDIIRFNTIVGNPTTITGNKIVNGIDAKLWVERYRNPGEFKFIGKPEAELQAKLPIGTLVSHVNSSEVMIVESHEIVESAGSDTKISITGRSFESYLENRILGSRQSFPQPDSTTPAPYTIASAYTWNQAVTMISQHIETGAVFHVPDGLAFITVVNLASILAGDAGPVERTFKRTTVHSGLMELLSVDNLGVKTLRYGLASGFGSAEGKITIAIHRGADKSSSVDFVYGRGEIKNGRYLWTNKNKKTQAIIGGKWVEAKVQGSFDNYARRAMFIEANDLDDYLSAAPSGATHTSIESKMLARANNVLAAKKDVELAEVEVNSGNQRYKYRQDYDLGDLVGVYGNYGASNVMRVTEYVETEDSTGYVGYPTLSVA